jgi:hypothetical protein
MGAIFANLCQSYNCTAHIYGAPVFRDGALAGYYPEVILLLTEVIAMLKMVSLFATTVLLFAFHSAHGEESAGDAQGATESPGSDLRQLVSMPEQARQLMREDMLDHLSALNEIIGYLAENNLDAAANVAQTRMGKSSMGKHRATGMGPGRFMPLDMRNIGWGMHESATEFSRIAKEGDIKGAYSALQKLTTSCVGCHYSFRTR